MFSHCHSSDTIGEQGYAGRGRYTLVQVHVYSELRLPEVLDRQL